MLLKHFLRLVAMPCSKDGGYQQFVLLCLSYCPQKDVYPFRKYKIYVLHFDVNINHLVKC